jgi:hypothetical protein
VALSATDIFLQPTDPSLHLKVQKKNGFVDSEIFVIIRTKMAVGYIGRESKI